jgi:hypothetical protein
MFNFFKKLFGKSEPRLPVIPPTPEEVAAMKEAYVKAHVDMCVQIVSADIGERLAKGKFYHSVRLPEPKDLFMVEKISHQIEAEIKKEWPGYDIQIKVGSSWCDGDHYHAGWRI